MTTQTSPTTARTQRGRFRFELATTADDAGLRALLRRNPMDGGSMQVGFEREPGFFAAARAGSDTVQVGVAREAATGRIVGLGTRAVRRAYVNGEARSSVGYLSDLRLEPELRGGTLVARGYRFFRELHQDGLASVYYTVIFADNRQAMNTLATGRAGLPGYRDLGLLRCPGIRLGKRPPTTQIPGVSIERGRHDTLPEVVACLDRNGRRKQFAAVHTVEDFDPAGTRWPGFRVEDFFVARRDGRVVGVVGTWDQRGFKQTRLHGYVGALRWAAPVLNALRPLAPSLLPQLPRVGESVPFFHVCFIAVDNDEVAVLSALLREVYLAYTKSEFFYFLVSLHERDPLLAALAGYSLIPFDGRLFRVTLSGEDERTNPLDGRVPGVEAATL